MNEISGNRSSLAEAEAALGAMMGTASADGACGGPWTHEITPVVKNCGVVSSNHRPVLQVNPVWLRDLVSRDELKILGDEMRTWFAIQSEVVRCNRTQRHQRGRCVAA